MPAGVPTFDKFDAEKREKYLQSLREGNSRSTAAVQAGVSRDLVWKYRKATEGWAEEEEAAEEEAHDLVEDALHQAAVSGNVTACQVWLYNRRPGRWKDRRNLSVGVGVGSGQEASEGGGARIILELPDNGRGDAHPALKNGQAPGNGR